MCQLRTKTTKTATLPARSRVDSLHLGFHVVIGVARLNVQQNGFIRQLHFTTHTQHQVQSSFLLDVVVRLCPVIVHSICSTNSCMFLIPKTCVLRCCLYRRGHGWFIVRMRLWDPPAWSHSYRHNRRGTCASPTTRTDLVMHLGHNVSTELAHLDTSFPQRPDAGRSDPPKLEPPSEKFLVGSARSRNPPERGSTSTTIQPPRLYSGRNPTAIGVSSLANLLLGSQLRPKKGHFRF